MRGTPGKETVMENEKNRQRIGLHSVRGSRGGDVSSGKTGKNIACGFDGHGRASAL